MPGAYRVLNKTLIRAGVEATSDKVGPIEAGEIIKALDVQLNTAGAQRVQFARGWVSVIAGNGTAVLEPMAVDPGKQLASTIVDSPPADDFHAADWGGGFAERWQSYARTVARVESGEAAMKELVSFLEKRAAMEESCASGLRGCLGDSAVSNTLSAAKGSALGWLSGATAAESPKAAGPQALPAEAAFAQEPFGSLRGSLLSAVAADSMRRAKEHAAQALALRALAQQLGAFAAKHAEKKAGLTTAAAQRLKKLDDAFVAVKKAETDFDRYSAAAVQSEQEFLRNMEDETMAQTPMMAKLQTQMTELKAKKDTAQEEFKGALQRAFDAEAAVYDRDLPHVLADIRDMEENRLTVMADALTKYAAVFEPSAASAASMQVMLQSAMAPVDVGFDMDGMASVNVVPTTGVVPAGYLSLPKQLLDRLAELSDAPVPAADAARKQATCAAPVVAVASLPAAADGVPRAVSALCDRITEAGTVTFEPLESTDGWTAVADIYAQLSSKDGAPTDALIASAPPAAALRCLQRVLRTLDTPLLTPEASAQLVETFGTDEPPAEGSVVPRADAILEALPSGPQRQTLQSVLAACSTVVARAREAGTAVPPVALAMLLGPALLGKDSPPSVQVAAVAALIEQQVGAAPAGTVKFVSTAAAAPTQAPAPAPAPVEPAVPVAVAADDSERQARVAAEARAADAERATAAAVAEGGRHAQALAVAESKRDAQTVEVERLSKALAAAEEATTAASTAASAASVAGDGEGDRVAAAVAKARDELGVAAGAAASEAAKVYEELKARHAEEMESVRAAAKSATEEALSGGDAEAALAASRALEIEKLTGELKSLHAEHDTSLAAEVARYSALEAEHSSASQQLEGMRAAKAQAAEAAAAGAEADALKAQLEKAQSEHKLQLDSVQGGHTDALSRMQAAHDERVAAYEADTAQLLADAEEKALTGSSAQKRQISAATAAHKDTEEKLKTEQAAHSALKEESGKLLEGVQAQMGGAVSQLTVQVKELSAKLGTTSKQLADADKERKLYIEAVRMLKLRLTDSDAKVKDFAAKRMLYENEIERLSEWVAEHTIAGAKVTSELENVPQASVEKWLTQLETSRHKVKSWRERLKQETGCDATAPAAQAALKRMLEEVRQAMRAEVGHPNETVQQQLELLFENISLQLLGSGAAGAERPRGLE